MQNFSSLALKLREEFEVTDRQTTWRSPIEDREARAHGNILQFLYFSTHFAPGG